MLPCSISSRACRCGGCRSSSRSYPPEVLLAVLGQGLAGSSVSVPVQLRVGGYGRTRLRLGAEVSTGKVSTAYRWARRRRGGWLATLTWGGFWAYLPH
jgi:hypothetical protein